MLRYEVRLEVRAILRSRQRSASLRSYLLVLRPGCLLTLALKEGRPLLRLVVIARHYWPRPGAASVRLQGLTEAARDQGWAVVVITTTGQDLPQVSHGPSGETIIRLRGDTSTGMSMRRAVDLVAFASRARIRSRQLGSADIVLCDPPPTLSLIHI